MSVDLYELLADSKSAGPRFESLCAHQTNQCVRPRSCADREIGGTIWGTALGGQAEAAGELRRRPVGAPLNSTHFRGTHVPVARSGVRPVYRGHGSAAIGAGRRTAGRTRSSVVLAWHRGLCIVASLVA
jgi:hypothetical protein